MAHELVSQAKIELSAKELAKRLALEFPIVKTDAQDALAEARRKAEWIERSPARVFLGRHEKALDFARRLKSLAVGDALTIEFGDVADKLVRIVVIPGERIRFGYASTDEESARKNLVDRCARALGCDAIPI